MLRPLSIAAWLLGALTASAGAGPFVQSVRANPAGLAACAFGVLDRAYPARVRMTERPAADGFRITRQAAGPIGPDLDLDMSIGRAGRGALLTIEPGASVFGDDAPARRTWREIQGCLPPGP